ncbi:MAG: DnaJ domain-containing protein [Chloroflexi bacterium]|nr:DnaJ domain-containing protein [Chloroflexota bacterium]
MSGRRTPHEVLGVSLGASADEIRAARRQLAREHHPDRFMGDPKSAAEATREMALINAAAEALLAEAWASDGAPAAEPPAKGGHKPERPVTASVVVDAAPTANARTSRPAPINWRPEQPLVPRAPRGPVGPLPGSPAGPVERSFAPLPADYRRPTLSEAVATVFAFGRYEGATVGYVAKRDPGYLVWCADNVRRDQELVRAANVVLDDLEERGAPHPPRGSTRRPTAPLFDPNRELE